MQHVATAPHIQLLNMSRAYVLSRAIHAIAKLGIANHMSFSPIDVSTLAKATGTQEALLDRLLTFLVGYQLFTYDEKGYSLTDLSCSLRDDDSHSVRDVLCMVDDSWWQAFSQLDMSLQTGESAFFHQHQDDFFSFLSKYPDKQTNFDRGMAKLSTYDDNAISQIYDFGKLSSLIDMGGGRGGLAKAIGFRYPELSITLFDTEAVIKQLDTNDFPKQVHLKAGDFLAHIPKANAYLFKGVLHDFNDETMNRILTNCHSQMPSDAKLLIAEQVMPEDNQPHPNKTMDMVMMVLLGGRQRTLAEWQKGIEPSGFAFKHSYQTAGLFTLMEFIPIK